MNHFCYRNLEQQKDGRYECSICRKIFTVVRFIKREK